VKAILILLKAKKNLKECQAYSKKLAQNLCRQILS